MVVEKMNVTDTPEFKAALAAAAKSIKDELTRDLKAALATTPAGSEDGAFTLARQMALAIGEIADQGTSRKRVAPEILAARAAAKERMGALILSYRDKFAAGDKAALPEYRLIAKVYFHERLVEPFQRGAGGRMVPVEVYWDGVPNEAMRPRNGAAEAIFKEFLSSIGGSSDITGVKNQPLWVTAKGVVVKAPPPATAVMHGLSTATMDPAPDVGGIYAPKEFDGRFVVKTQNDPNAPLINVLGTVAAPARQNATNELI